MKAKSVYCCNSARASNFLRHAKNCRVWKYRDMRDLKQFDKEDIGKGDGCEGAKCAL